MPRKMSDRELVAVIEDEIRLAAGYTSGQLAEERSDALEAYLGEPYGDEVEGRSEVVTREVLEAVEDLMPSLMRIFADSENLFDFDPVGPDDVDQAKQASWRVSREFWKNNEGFLNLYTFCKDALVSKTGILKVWFDDKIGEEREDYRGVSEMEIASLLSDNSVDREVIEDSVELNDDGTIDVSFKAKPKNGRVRVEPTPGEEFGVSRDARSPNVKKADFVYHRTPMLRSDLLGMGYPKSVVDRIPRNNDVDTEETLSRRHILDEQHTINDSSHSEHERVWVAEAYMRLDYNRDGIAELMKVVIANSSPHFGAGGILLEKEEVDRIPFCTTPANLLTHKFYGLSIADLVMDIQRINTTLTRGILDNTYLSNNQRMAANRNVNMDDLLVSRPGGVVRTKGEAPPLNNLAPIPTQQIPQSTFMLLERMDGLPEQRVGSGSTSQLDPKALSNMNVGVAAMALDQSKAKVELLARIIAEVGLKDVFRDIYELLSKNIQHPESQQFEGQWIEMNPGHWRARDHMTINVGIGVANRERKQLALEKVLERHSLLAQMGGIGTFVGPENIFHALEDEAQTLGLTSGRYYMDPANAQPKKEEEPNIEMLTLQVNAKAAEDQIAVQREKNQLQWAEVQLKAKMQSRKDAADIEEMQVRKEIEAIELQTTQLREQAAAGNEEARMQMEFHEKRSQNRIEELQLRLEQVQSRNDRAMEKYKADLEAATKLALENMKKQEGESAESKSSTGEVAAKLQELMEAVSEIAARPKGGKAVYDGDGNLSAIGDIPVHYDDNGDVLGVGDIG
jgi:hypothetical protein